MEDLVKDNDPKVDPIKSEDIKNDKEEPNKMMINKRLQQSFLKIGYCERPYVG